MNQEILLLLSLGAGGAVGAVATLLATWARLDASLHAFRMEFERSSPPAELRARFDDLRRDATALTDAADRLRRVLRIR
jgi:hypothetical protein